MLIYVHTKFLEEIIQMLLNELFEQQTNEDKTTKFIVYEKKTTKVLYYGTSEEQAINANVKGTVLNKPLKRSIITQEDYALYNELSNMFY